MPSALRFEVAREVRPAELAAREREVAIGPPAIRGHDRLRLGEQVLGVVFVTVGGDVQIGVVAVEDAPQRAALTSGSATRVSSMCTAAPARNRSSRSSQGSSSASAIRARIASTVPVLIRDPYSCSHSSTTFTARDAVAHRQRRDRRLQARTNELAAISGGSRAPPTSPAPRASACAGSDARSR